MTATRRLVLVLSIVLALTAAGCGSDGGDTSSDTSAGGAPSTTGPTTTAAGAGASTTTTGGGGGQADVRVYFARDEAVATAGRPVPTPAVAGAAMQALLD